GALLHIVVGRPAPLSAAVPRLQRNAYLLFIGYMLLQSFVGIVVNDDMRLVRWVVFYGMLGVLSSIVYYRNNEFPFPSARSTALIVMISGLVYYTAYLVQGVIEEAILGQWGRYLTQDYVWSGSAYAVFPTLVATPAALYLMNDGARWVRTLAWGAIAQMMVVAWYYDS